jgi:CHAT domain-containing protein
LESYNCFYAAQTLFENIGDRLSEQFCLKCLMLIRFYNMGKTARDANSNNLSLERFEKAINLGREIGLLDFELKCIRQKGLTYWQMGKINLFLECNRIGLDISCRINHRIEKGRCLNNIGVYYQKLNDYSLALIYLENALSIIRAEDDEVTEAECLSNIGILYRDLGNLEKAQTYLLNALRLDEKLGKINSISIDLDNIGSIYLRGGIDSQNRQELLKALDVFNNCLSLQGQEKANPLIKFAALNNIGIVHSELEHYTKARAYFVSALKIVGEGKYMFEKCYVLNNIAATYFYEKKIGEAIEIFKKALDIGSEYKHENSIMESCLGLGQCYENRTLSLFALSYYKRAIEAMESVRDRISSEFFTIGFARNKMTAYQRVIEILANIYYSKPSITVLEEIFEFVERAKARAFLDSINEAKEDAKKGNDSRLIASEREISLKISILSKRLIADGLAAEIRERINNELEVEEEKYLRLMSEMKTENFIRGLGTPREICSISLVQEKIIDDRTALLEYYLGEIRSYVIYISKKRAKIFELAGRKDIEKSLRAYMKMISSKSNYIKVWHEAAKRIGRELIPLELGGKEEGIEKLIIIPDGILHYLPFETIRTNIDQIAEYLIEKIAISYCPSVSSLLFLLKEKKHIGWPKQLLAVGGPIYGSKNFLFSGSKFENRKILRQMYFEQGFNFTPLPFSKKEVLEIARYFPKKQRDILVGENASEGSIKKLPLDDYRLIHFACHGILDEKYPFRSALVLTQNDRQQDDGFLQMREIYSLTVNADLVVLSACQTGNGILEKAEGPMGLARPFFFAGARSVVSSLWAINDKATVFFMQSFYKYLVGGCATNKALQLAKIKMLRSNWSHPFYWAGFILNGDPEAVVINR